MAEIKRSVDCNATLNADTKPTIIQDEASSQKKSSRWKVSKSDEGDTAMALFNDPNEISEVLDEKEVRKLVWKINFMILPYLTVCYAFFYIDKVSISPLLSLNWS
jgi:hypothetical protein